MNINRGPLVGELNGSHTHTHRVTKQIYNLLFIHSYFLAHQCSIGNARQELFKIALADDASMNNVCDMQFGVVFSFYKYFKMIHVNQHTKD
jgi:hypothetical protein